MSIVFHLAAQALAAGHPGHPVPAALPSAPPVPSLLAVLRGNPQLPDPPPAPPPGFAAPVNTILGWIKWGAIVSGSVGMSACGLMMILGRRNRSSLAGDGAAGIPYVLLGLIVVSAGSAIAGVFL